MSIADKITSIEGHLTDDYEGLENLGADLTNVNKNIQNIRTCLDNIYTNLPKTTGEGSNLSLTTLKGRINVDDILGDTQQDTYKGYNLLPSINTTRTINGVTFTHNADGSITANGTSTDIALYRINVNSETGTRNVSIPAGNWYCTDGVGDYTNYFTQCTNGTIYMNTGSGSSGVLGKSNMVTTTETSTFQAHIYIRSGVTINNVTFKPMIVSSANVDKPYEQYTGGTASPNPTYPQDINVVTGTQEVVVQNKNLFNKDNYNYINAWFLKKSSNISAKSGNDTIIYIKCRPNTTYTISKILEPNTSKNTLVVGTTTDIPNYGVALNVKAGEQGTTITDVTITTGSNDKYLCVFCHSLNANNTYNVAEMLATLQIEIGSTKTDYVEHQEQTKTLHLGDIELSKIGTYQDRIFETSGKNLANVDETQIGKAWNNASNNARAILVLPIEHNTQYTISYGSLGSIEGVYYGYRTDETTAGSGVTQMSANPTTITTNDTNNYMVFQFNKTSISLADIKAINLMLNEGSTALPYEPYGSDKWYIEKKIGHKKASEITENDIGGVGGSQSVYFTSSFTNVIANRTLQVYSNVQTWKNTTDTEWNTLNGNYIGVLFNVQQIYINKTASTKSELITWLNSINFEMYYVLATPTYTEITNETLLNELNELEKMMSYNGQTNISVSGNLPMILDITALKGE